MRKILVICLFFIGCANESKEDQKPAVVPATKCELAVVVDIHRCTRYRTCQVMLSTGEVIYMDRPYVGQTVEMCD